MDDETDRIDTTVMAEGMASAPAQRAPWRAAMWVWLTSAACVVVLGVLSGTSGARVPFLWGIDLGIHEFGHLVTYWAPWRVTAIAGSVFQVAMPLALAAYYGLARREWWAAAPLLAWAGASARNVAVYIADAPYQRLQLLGGPGVLHDWAQLLAGQPMRFAGVIAWTVNAAGWAMIAAGLVIALWPPLSTLVVETRRRREARIFEARKPLLPVHEPHGPIGG
jgi:hypothetical protein